MYDKNRLSQSTSTSNEELQDKLPAAIGHAGPSEKKYFLQNKLPAVSRQPEPRRKKVLFAKQTAGGESSSRPALTPAIAGNYHRSRG